MGIVNYKIYTPYKYADEITREGFKEYFQGEYSKEKINNLKIADLSCGTGNLLCVALEKLIRLSKKIFGKYVYKESWITAYDLDELALQQYKENILKILKKYNLSGEIKTYLGDSLTTEINEKYNLVLGNPPYIGEKNNKELFSKIKETSFGKKYYQSKMDYLYFFIEKGVDILEENGILSYIVTNYWLKADSGTTLRNKLKEEGSYKYLNNFNTSVFKEVNGQHNVIFVWRKKLENTKCFIKNSNLDEEELENNKENTDLIQEKFEILNEELYDEKGNIILLNPKNKKIIKNILEKSNYRLKDFVNINQGIISGYDGAFITEMYSDDYKDILKPLYKNKDINKYSHKKENKFWIFYVNTDTEVDNNFLDYLSIYQKRLKERREVKSGKINWWELQWGREEKIFKGEKIVVRQRCKTNIFAYSNGDFYGSADIYYLSVIDKNINIFYLLGYLNSKIFYKWYRINGKSKGYNLEFYTTPLKEVPIYYPDNIQEIKFIEDLVKQQIENYSEDTQGKIEKYFSNIYGV
ncbi:Eco57I restriction-modification methylase domain-containing protein [Fusobacterium perfoetens]|uniref:Eco57I restriction-modification methylase domain-containing protein n=1 Tax=Fusobacterium perfoetens TaxID=852 RepID=UPI00048779AC|nr:TaqI-like C-terminal specificity domain-containing protein [Fusobacterium perfoetens]MCI6153427.1 Eco57I restriction-modification methylase domain-containing protein [Fusobacterium perfoetens]MDY3238430.1 TaqI-like C-terminal specificity domain-containing protein [Fusobacterium perfoetens]